VNLVEVSVSGCQRRLSQLLSRLLPQLLSQLLDGAAVGGAAWFPETAVDLLTHPTVQRVLDRARRDPAALAVILFGSHTRREASSASDVDLCLVLASDSISSLEMSRFRLAYLAEGAISTRWSVVDMRS
jgi:predicted nucleotidyltransferase